MMVRAPLLLRSAAAALRLSRYRKACALISPARSHCYREDDSSSATTARMTSSRHWHSTSSSSNNNSISHHHSTTIIKNLRFERSPHVPARSFSTIASYQDEEIDKNPLHPPPTDDSLHKRGVPILVRAAHHAAMGRALCYDAYNTNSNEQQLTNKNTKVEYTYAEVLDLSTAIHRYLITHRDSVPLDLDPESNTTTRPTIVKRNTDSPAPPRIAFLCNPSSSYVACQWASWSSGSIAVPLCTAHKSEELQYVLEDCTPDIIIDGVSHPSESEGDTVIGTELRKAAEQAGMADRIVCFEDIISWPKEGESGSSSRDDNDKGTSLDALLPSRRFELGCSGLVPSLDSPALIIYTSGTTGNPKGVVSTHRNLYHQITDLVRSWGWTADDAIIHILPLHHVHGVVNKLGCAVYAGATVEFMRFNPMRMWERLAVRHDPKKVDSSSSGGGTEVEGRRAPTLIMAVPTVYAKMLEVLSTMPSGTLEDALAATLQSTVRLTVSGSAALPTSIFERWRKTTGHTMLERYGMTELGMALSNPLEPIDDRLPGYVGTPLPSVEVKIVDEDTGDIIPPLDDNDQSSDRSGELCVRGPTVFSEYWNKPHATAESFDFDGYFRTGDVAEYDPKVQSYHILGRVSADIIKCGGHKLSSLQIERVLLEHPRLEEAVVLGVPDETYGERVALICRLKDQRVGEAAGGDTAVEQADASISLQELQAWCKERMADYKIPTRLIVITDDVPKNAMGKVSKKQLVHLFDEENS